VSHAIERRLVRRVLNVETGRRKNHGERQRYPIRLGMPSIWGWRDGDQVVVRWTRLAKEGAMHVLSQQIYAQGPVHRRLGPSVHMEHHLDTGKISRDPIESHRSPRSISWAL